jgi:hypothetical protein
LVVGYGWQRPNLYAHLLELDLEQRQYRGSCRKIRQDHLGMGFSWKYALLRLCATALRVRRGDFSPNCLADHRLAYDATVDITIIGPKYFTSDIDPDEIPVVETNAVSISEPIGISIGITISKTIGISVDSFADRTNDGFSDK